MAKALPVRGQQVLTVPVTQPMRLTVDELIAEDEELQDLKRRKFRENYHYGTIGDSPRPILLKPGATAISRQLLLGGAFRLIRRDREAGHYAYDATCRLIYRPTREMRGEGNATCSSMETKYRYRRSEAESTGRLIPQAFWSLRKTNPQKAQELIGGPEFMHLRIDGVWMICRRGSERVENEEIEGLDHTIKLMAQKRSFINALLTWTAAGELFVPANPEDDDDDDNPPEQTGRKEAGSSRAAPTSATPERPEPRSYKAALWEALNDRYEKNRVAGELRLLTGKASLSDLTEEEAKRALWNLDQDGDGRGDEFELK